MKAELKKLFLLCIVSLTFSPVVYANQIVQEQINGKEGQTIYHVQYDYDAISQLLGINRHVYEKNWENGFSIAEMADKLWIERQVIEAYFMDFHYQEMKKWRAKGALSEEDYFELLYTLKDDITTFIERNPNRQWLR